MDTERGLNQGKADEALRSLFKEAGHSIAPEGMDARIFSRIAVTAPSGIATDRPIIPLGGWIGAGVIGVALIGSAVISPSATGAGWASQSLQKMPKLDLSGILTSPWVLAIVMGSIGLFALDSILSRRRPTSVTH